MISFNYELDFELTNADEISSWISNSIVAEKFKEGEINFIFCSDDYLYNLNVEFLNHDSLTDIISFDCSVGKELHGDVFISVERVKENAKDYDVSFSDELNRVMIHGILHLCKYNDKTEEEKRLMREKENHYLSQFS
jgi:rRNA maturation RNase YbeY